MASHSFRPSTAAPQPTLDSAHWSATSGDGDDAGMFSFLAPGAASESPSLPDVPIDYSPYPSAHDSAAGTPRVETLAGGDARGNGIATPVTLPRSEGNFRRETFDKVPDDVGYDAEWGDQGQSDTSSSYGIDENGRRVEGMRMEVRGPLQPTRSEDEKMIAEFDALNAADPNLNPAGYYLDDDEEDSPYPEVRASVSNYDDPDMPVLTFRSWTLGIFFALAIGGLNAFFMFRYPSPTITPVIIQVVSFPCGKFLAWLLPDRSWRTPNFIRRLGASDDFSFNPGPFSIKEHTIIVIMANVASSQVIVLNFSVMSSHFYSRTLGVTFDVLVVLTTAMLGFGVAGMCRRFLVWPASLIWPQNLVFCTLLNTLHAEEDTAEGGGISRFKVFMYTMSGAFTWYFLPGFLFQALSAFSFICWAAPNNRVVNQLFGVSSGLGMGLLTFDWAQISYTTNPLVVPWWAEVNVFIGFFIAFWVICPIMYYTNVWNTAYLPISTSGVFDRFGAPYNTSAVVDVTTVSLNVTAYQSYSPLYIPVTYATVYCIAFALTMALITHTALYHGREIIARVKTIRTEKEEEDIHYKLMQAYKEVPDWWYFLYLVIFVAISIATIAHWDTQMPVWALIVALFFGLIYVVPGGIVYAMTSQEITLNLLVDLMGGYMMPGQPLGVALFKVYAIQPLGTALVFVQDLKLGHYMKIPPRATFIAQLVATFLTCLLQVGIKEWLVQSVPDFCDPHQSAYLTCPLTQVMYSGSIIWGLIGPARQFSVGMVYNPILYAMLVGALLPVPFWLISRRYPKVEWLANVNIPVMLTGATFMPPATGINFSSWFLVGFIFQYVARRRHFRWWSKFNFSLAAALDCGTALCVIFIFLTLQLPKGGTIAVNWWGNTVFTETDDWNGTPYLTSPPEGFGPSTWA